MNKTLTLRRKLLTWLLLPMLVLWLISAALTYYLAFRFANYAYDYSLMDSPRDLAGQIVVLNGKASLDLPLSARHIFLSDKMDTIYYNVARRDRTVLSGETDLPLPDFIRKPGVSTVRNGTFRGRKVRIASLSYLPPGLSPDQSVLIQVAETLNKRKRMAGQIIATMLLPQLLLIMLAALIVWTGIGRGLAPLEQLHGEIAARSDRDLSPVEETNTPEEVRPIIHEINGLMNRLDKALEAQRRFIADAAHQLRTPLAGLKTQVSLALRQTVNGDLRHSLKQIDESADRTIRLVNQMLALAQVEPGSDRLLDLKPLDLGKLVRETVKDWVPAAIKRDIDLGYEGLDGAVRIEGDTVRLKMMIDNLIDNAVRYSANGSSITTKLGEADGSVTLTVEDNGTGIPPGEREAVFQRFYRVPGNPVAGSGLGLSIVQDIVKSHGARISIEAPAGHSGTLVRVTFPRIN
jgi:two-component system sensor histidine kinase TctE